jgi:hypothetical protein
MVGVVRTAALVAALSAGVGCSEVTVVPEPSEPADQICHEPCDVEPTFACVTACRAGEASAPTCVAGAWECPPVDGRFPSSLCEASHASGECGGTQEIGCPDGFYCDFGEVADGTCGRSGQMGICNERPPACYGYVEPRVPYCGCGGGRGNLERCPEPRPYPPGTYATCNDADDLPNRCGPWLDCTGRSYCVRRPSGPAGAFDYRCEVGEIDPNNPTAARCELLRAHACGANCEQLGDMVLLTCACADEG